MRARLFAPVVLALTMSGCGSDFTAPDPITLRVSVTTAGADVDENGYYVRVGTVTRLVQPNATLGLRMEPGSYDVHLDDIAANCTVGGSDRVSVTVLPKFVDHLPQVSFEVTCRAVSAAVEVMASSSGRDFPASGYQIRVSDGASLEQTGTAFPNVPVVFAGLAAGSYAVTISGVRDNCALSGPESQTVSLTVGGVTRDSARIVFSVTCEATTGDINVTTVTTGTGIDPDGYTLTVDGEPLSQTYYDYYYGYGYVTVPVRLRVTGSQLVEQRSPGDHTVELTEIAPNCSVSGPNPVSVSVTVGAVSRIRFDVACN